MLYTNKLLVSNINPGGIMNENDGKDIYAFFKIAQQEERMVRLFQKNGIGRIKGFIKEADNMQGVVVIALKNDPTSPIIFYKVENISGWMFYVDEKSEEEATK